MLYIMPIMPETTNIQITKQTYEELRKIGIMGDNYNKLINELIVKQNLNELSE